VGSSEESETYRLPADPRPFYTSHSWTETSALLKAKPTIFVATPWTSAQLRPRGHGVQVVASHAVKRVFSARPLKMGSIPAVIKEPQAEIKCGNDRAIGDSR